MTIHGAIEYGRDWGGVELMKGENNLISLEVTTKKRKEKGRKRYN